MVRIAVSLALAGLLVVLSGRSQDLPESAYAQTTIDQISIDMNPDDNPLGTPASTPIVNGDPAVGDRNLDALPDSEGVPVGVCGTAPPWSGDGTDDDGDTTIDDGCPAGPPMTGGTPEQGLCGNGIDDDPQALVFDGVADDGCVTTLGPRDVCAEIADNNILDKDEDELIAGTRDTVWIDVTVGAQPGPGGGIPASMVAWVLDLNWCVPGTGTDPVLNPCVAFEVVDVATIGAYANGNAYFLLAAAGLAPPFTNIVGPTPATTPFNRGALDAGPTESGPGVLARIPLEGNAAGLADLTLTDITIKDNFNVTIPIDTVNIAQVAVDQPCPEPADIQVVTATISPIANTTVNTPFNVTVNGTVQNNGPATPVLTDVDATLTPPADCSVDGNPAGQAVTKQTDNDISLVSGAAATPITPAVFNVTCTDPSFHSFQAAVTATVNPPHIDPNPVNNSLDTSAVQNAITAEADIKITSQVITGTGPLKCPALSDPTPQPPYGTGVIGCTKVIPYPALVTGIDKVITVEKDLHNNGPRTPVNVDVTKGALVAQVVGDTMSPADDCTIVPPGGSATIDLDLSVTVDHDEDFTINCNKGSMGLDDDGDTWIDEDPANGVDDDGDTTIDEDSPYLIAVFAVQNQITPTDPHIEDPNLVNNDALTLATFLVERPFDPVFTSRWDEDPAGQPDEPFIPPVGDDCILGQPCEMEVAASINCQSGGNCVGDVPGDEPLAGLVTTIPGFLSALPPAGMSQSDFALYVTRGDNDAFNGTVPNGTRVGAVISATWVDVITPHQCNVPLGFNILLYDAALPAEAGGGGVYGEGPNVAGSAALADPDAWPTNLEADPLLSSVANTFGGWPSARAFVWAHYVGMVDLGMINIPVNLVVFSANPPAGPYAAPFAGGDFVSVSVTGDPVNPSAFNQCTPYTFAIDMQGEVGVSGEPWWTCLASTDTDGDTIINDGCPQVGATPDTVCGDNLDDDAADDIAAVGIAVIDDGCPPVGPQGQDLKVCHTASTTPGHPVAAQWTRWDTGQTTLQIDLNTCSPSTGTITVTKVLDTGTEPLTSFCFTLSPDPGNGEVCADAVGDAEFTDVPAGTYSAVETSSPATYHEVSNNCSGTLSIVNQGDADSCTFHDAENTGTITVTKVLDTGTEPLTSFCFTLSPDPGNGEVCADAGTGEAVFTNVPAGTYSASETSLPGSYHEVSNNCSGLSIVNQDDTDSCTITNTLNSDTFTVTKEYSDASTDPQVEVSLACDEGGSPVTVTGSPQTTTSLTADFTVTGWTDSAQVVCTSTETSVPPGYSSSGTCSAPLSPAGGCTIVNTFIPDSDGDGVPDAFDACPTLQEDTDGYQDADGCPDPDNDMDGICDPGQTSVSCTGSDFGQMAFYPAGHPLGVPPSFDCRNIPEDYDAFHDTDGCPDPDNDNDGFPDFTDQCPGTYLYTGPDGAFGSPQDDNLNGIKDGTESPHSTDDIVLVFEDWDGVIDTDGCHDSPGDDYDGDAFSDEDEVFIYGTSPTDPDTDDDGIEDGVDGLSERGDRATVLSNSFTDNPGGTTFGQVVDSGGLSLSISDLPDPSGVRVVGSGSGGPATVLAPCSPEGTYTLTPGDMAYITCSSLSTLVIAGPVEVTFGSITATLPSQTSATVEETAPDVFEVSTGGLSSVDVGGLSVPPGQVVEVTDTDTDGLVNQADPDDDGDGVSDTDETACGAAALIAGSVPERLDTVNIDDNGDTLVDEALPPGSGAFDCDGDGWTGAQEKLIFSASGTANDQDPCGNNGWPADLFPDNTLNIGDFNSFTTPPGPDDGHGIFNYFGHSVPDVDINGPPDDSRPNAERWNLDQQGAGAVWIDIGDMNAINPGVVASTARPPMIGGEPAFFTDGGQCPWDP